MASPAGGRGQQATVMDFGALTLVQDELAAKAEKQRLLDKVGACAYVLVLGCCCATAMWRHACSQSERGVIEK